MSIITIEKNWSCTKYTNGVGVSNGSGFVVGMDRGGKKDNYYIIRIPIKTPTQTDQLINITSIQTTRVIFTTTNVQEWASYGVGNIDVAATSDDKIVYGLFSTNGALTDSQIRASSESFKIVDAISQNTKKIECSINKTLRPNTQYYLYIFTKNIGGNQHTAWYYWPSNDQLCKFELECNYITYTKLSYPPEDGWFSSVKIKPGDSVTITAPAGVDNQSSFLVRWSGAQSGQTTIAPKQSYTFQSNTNVSRGQEITFSATRIHAVDQKYNSDVVQIKSKISINQLPIISGISTSSTKTISYHTPTLVPITITAQDEDSDIFSIFFRVDDGKWQTSGTSAKIKNGSVITAYANDGTEDGPFAIYTVGTSTIGNLTVNTPPVLEGTERINYIFESNKIEINGIGDEQDNYECYFTAYKNNIKVQETGWKSGNSKDDKISFILSDYITTSFDKVNVSIRKKDDYDVSPSYSQEITAPSISIGDSFLNEITIGNLSQYWKVKAENLQVDNTASEHKITITNPNDLLPNNNYSFNIIGVFGGEDQWSWQTTLKSKNFVKFTTSPDLSSLEGFNPFHIWCESDKDSSTFISVGIYQEKEPNFPDEVKLVLKYNGKEKEVEVSTYSGSNNDTFIGECNLRSLFDFSQTQIDSSLEYALRSFYGQKTVQGYFKYNIDNIIISSPVANFTMDFDYLTKPPIPSLEKPVYETYIPTLKSNHNIATQDNIICILEVNRGNGFVEYDRKTFTVNSDLEYTVSNDTLNLPLATFSFDFNQIGEIADTNEREWRFKFMLETNNNCVAYSEPIITPVVKQISPSGFQPGAVTWTDNKATIAYSINWETNAENYTKEVAIIEGKEGEEVSLENDILKYTPPENNLGPYKIQLEFTTKYQNITKSKIFDAFTIYRDGPTVAYRRHHIGINTTDFSNNDVIVSVQRYENRNIILLNENSVVGAIIDCGSWDTPAEEI